MPKPRLRRATGFRRGEDRLARCLSLSPQRGEPHGWVRAQGRWLDPAEGGLTVVRLPVGFRARGVDQLQAQGPLGADREGRLPGPAVRPLLTAPTRSGLRHSPLHPPRRLFKVIFFYERSPFLNKPKCLKNRNGWTFKTTLWKHRPPGKKEQNNKKKNTWKFLLFPICIWKKKIGHRKDKKTKTKTPTSGVKPLGLNKKTGL